MNFNAPSFFAGIAATAGILALGFGGGVVVSGMLSGDTRPPNKIERQQAARETPARELAGATPTIEPKPIASAPPAVPPSNPPAQSASAAMPAEPPPPAAAQAPPQPATEPEPVAAPRQPVSPPPTPQPAREAASPPPRIERPVSLEQPQRLSRREIRRMWREERAKRREEQRRQMAERRRQDDLRRQQQRDAERAAVIERRPSGRDVDDDDDDDLRQPVRPAAPLGGPFGLFRGAD